MKALFELTPWRLRRRIEILSADLAGVRATNDARLDALESGLRTVQGELAELRDGRTASAENRLDVVEGAVSSVAGEARRLRDDVVPAVVGRADALLERLAAELDEVGSLVERQLRGDPLPVPGDGPVDESRLASALAEVQPALLEAFRGSESEIRHRLDRYLEALAAAPPVLDLGCGRGELLLMLREAGVEAAGIEGDPAVAQAARRRGLDVIEGDVLEMMRRQPDGSRGAVTAIHLAEHLEPANLIAVIAEIRRVLRPGGLLIVESPNPHSLRVGASLFWIDPTHRRPLPPETLELFLTAGGLTVERREGLHPFPDEQRFAAGVAPSGDRDGALAAEVERIARRLDELVNGPRDFAVWARKTEIPTA